MRLPAPWSMCATARTRRSWRIARSSNLQPLTAPRWKSWWCEPKTARCWIASRSATMPLTRQMFDYGKQVPKPSDVVRHRQSQEGDIGDDVNINKIHEGVGNTYYFHKFQNGRLYDDKASRAEAERPRHLLAVRLVLANNAARLARHFQMVYGDGDGSLFINPSQGFDVSAHELNPRGHQFHVEPDLSGTSQAHQRGHVGHRRAAAEAWSTRAVALVATQPRSCRRWAPVIDRRKSWPDAAGGALRFMSNPTGRHGEQRQPRRAHHARWTDRGGVHLNSGIVNLAFLSDVGRR